MAHRDEQSAEPIELCFASMNFAPFFGGAALRYQKYMPGFAERGVRTTVFAATGSRRDEHDAAAHGLPAADVGEILPQDRVEGVPVHRIGLPQHGARPRFGHFFRGLHRFCTEEPRPDLVHILNLHWPALRWIGRIRAAGIPVVFSHTLRTRPAKNPLKAALQRSYEALPYRSLDAIVASTEIMREELRAKGVRTRIEVIYNGVDLTRFRPPAPGDDDVARLRAGLGVSEGTPLVLAVGAIEPRKRIDLLLRGFARLAARDPAPHLVVAGPRHDRTSFAAYGATLETIQREAGIGERVHFLGAVDDVDAWYRAADLFVLTTAHEGMNNAFFEAMASGLPVLTVPFEGIEAAHGRPGDQHERAGATPEELGAQMHALLDDAERRAALGRAGHAWAHEHMDVERVKDAHVALYRELVRERAGPRR